MKLLCPYLTLDQMQTNMGNPGFTQQAANDLGIDGTPADGFDGLLATLAQAIADEGGFLHLLDSLIGAADFAPGEFAGSELDSVISLFAGAFAAGDSLVNAVNATITGGVPTVPPPSAPVVSPVPVRTPPVRDPSIGGGVIFGGEPPWFDPTNPDTWKDASGGGPMIPPLQPWNPNPN